MANHQTGLRPPFDTSLIKELLPLSWPAWTIYNGAAIRPKAGGTDLGEFLSFDLCPVRLDKVYRHLHYAGAPRHARSLHRQILLGRDITITEDISEHLVWYSKKSKLFLKPLPAYLFDESIWQDHLSANRELHKSACGFILSYVWLVRWESDFSIAKAQKLLPAGLTWDVWADFVHSFTDRVDLRTLHQVARRYQYGELRLSRLNRIYRYSFTTFSLQTLFRGFMTTSAWYQDVFRNNFGWVLAVFAIFSVALSGMQVALMTNELSQNSAFHAASYGFSVFSLVALAACLGAMFCCWILLLLYFYISAKMYHHKVQSERRAARSGSNA